MNCLHCGVPLTGGLDTFGDHGLEVCQACWLAGVDTAESGSWYGLGPHEHAHDDEGRIIIGGTKFLPLPPPDRSGNIVIGGWVFVPDPEAPGCGVWRRKAA